MEQKTHLYLICDTQTDWHKEKRIHGSSDIELNEEGIQQAKLLCEVLQSFPVQAVYTSPKKRAHQTAKIIAESFNVKPAVNKALTEKCLGLVEGMGHEEYQQRYKEQLNDHFNLGYYERLFNKIVEDQESCIDVAERVLPALHDICSQHLDQHVVVVTHDWIAKLLLILIGKYKEESISIENGAILELQGNGTLLEIISMQGIQAEKGSIIQNIDS